MRMERQHAHHRAHTHHASRSKRSRQSAPPEKDEERALAIEGRSIRCGREYRGMIPRLSDPITRAERVLIVAVLALLAALAFTAEARASRPHRGTVAYCKAHAAGLVERKCIVRVVFAPVGQSRKAVAVAWCESRVNPRAVNGQYRGVFQMGAGERARYGHGRTVEAQSRAALRYYRLAGWRPWGCS